MKYIDAEKLIAEIEDRLHCNGAFDEVGDCEWHYDQGMVAAYNHIKDFITSLQQEQPEVDLDAEIYKADIMTGIEYMKTICPTTSVGREPNREDVADAFEDGVAEGYKRHWKPSEEQMEALAMYTIHRFSNSRSLSKQEADTLDSLYNDLKKLM